MDTSQARTIALLSPCGWGNLGDAAIVDAVIGQIRARVSEAKFIGITLNPEDTVRRHGIPAVGLHSSSSAGYVVGSAGSLCGIDFPSLPPLKSGKIEDAPMLSKPDKARSEGLWTRLSRPLRLPLYLLKRKTLHILRSYRILKNVDWLIVSGGGQLDDYWGGSWGHPYALFKWGTLARLTRTRFMILGVGTGSLKNVVSKTLIWQALNLAEFRSFRDSGSKDMVRFARVTRSDPVGPDLAFGLNVDQYRRPIAARKGSLRVGVSPIAYLHPKIWPEKNATEYAKYVQKMATFVKELIKLGHQVVFFTSEGADEIPVTGILELLDSESGLGAATTRQEVKSVESLLKLLSELDLVVASRLHSVLLSCLMECPTLALGYERKVLALMQDLTLADYMCDISLVDNPELIASFRRLLSQQEQVRQSLQRTNEANRRVLEEYFDGLCGTSPAKNQDGSGS